MSSDAARLNYLMALDLVDGIIGVDKDLFEFALEEATKEGRPEPNQMDFLNGFRMLLDEGMKLFYVTDELIKPEDDTFEDYLVDSTGGEDIDI